MCVVCVVCVCVPACGGVVVGDWNDPPKADRGNGLLTTAYWTVGTAL